MSHTYCSQKPASLRSAAASAKVLLGPRVFELVQANQVKEGDMLSVSQLAGIEAAKNTGNLNPLRQNVPIITEVRALCMQRVAANLTAAAAVGMNESPCCCCCMENPKP